MSATSTRSSARCSRSSRTSTPSGQSTSPAAASPGGPRMKVGVAMFSTDYAVDPATLARLVEERGFESLWFPEHTHIPTSRKTPYPAGGDLPKMYSHTYDPFVALAAAAAATERLKLGTGICLVIERDPIITAKE